MSRSVSLLPLRWIRQAVFGAAAALCVGPGGAVAQEAPAGLTDGEAAVRWVAGRPMLRATLQAGERVYFCHLLLDLSARRGLFLHENAGGSLRSESADVDLGGIRLRDVPFAARRDTWLEGLTARFATELQQVPVAGILGLGALPAGDLVLDGPGGALRLRPASGPGSEAPPVSPMLAVVPLLGDPGRDGLLLQADLGADVRARLRLHTRDPFGWLSPELCRQAGHADGVLRQARLGPHLDAARFAPFRPLRSEAGDQGGIGGAVLQQWVLTIQRDAGRLLIEHPADAAYPSTEAAFYRARYGDPGPSGLQAFLVAHPDAPEAGEAAAELMERLGDARDPTALEVAALASIRAAPANGKGTAALAALDRMPDALELAAVRRTIAEAGLVDARADQDGNAVHRLRLELGRLLLREKDLPAARRHLLAAVFGMPIDGAANLAMGRWHQAMDEPERALGRFFLATLDARNTGEAGFRAWLDLFRRLRPDADPLATLRDDADGRVPAFEPLPRDPATIRKTGRTVLVELFTGAMCPPCVAADVACAALGSHYDADEVVLVQWHLPIPAPEPLVAPPSLERAGMFGVRGTPTVVFGGVEQITGGGRAEAAPDMFRRYAEVVTRELAKAPVVRLGGRCTRDGDQVELSLWAEPAAADGALPAGLTLHAVLVEDLIAWPGRNGILFHHEVARARLLPASGAAAAGHGPTDPVRASASLAEIARGLDRLIAGYETEREFLVRPTTPAPERLAVVCWAEDGSGTVVQAVRLPCGGGGGKR